MTVFEITENDVTVKRFSASGLHDLKSAGVTNSYKNESGYEPNTEVIKSPQTIKLQKFITGETFTSNGVSVTAPNLTGLNVTKIFGTADTVKYSTTQFSSYASYDINPVGYTQGDEAKVTITLDAADGFDPTRPVLVYDKSANKYTTASIANGKVTFIAEHFSVYDIAQIKSVVIEVPVVSAGPAERTYTRVTSLSSLVSGDQYLIIHNGQNDFMIPVIVSSDTRIGYDLVKAPSGLGGTTLSGDYQAYEWKFESVSGGWHIGSSAGYMYFEAAGSRHAAKLGTTAHTMVISGTADKFTFKNATYSNGSFVLNYNGTGDLINGYASGPAPFYIYRLTSEGTGGPTVTTGNNGWVQLSAPVSGTGADDVKPSGDSWVTLTPPSSGEKIYRLTDTLVANKNYVIVSTNTEGNGTATNANANGNANGKEFCQFVLL
jgi:hypothetical protein